MTTTELRSSLANFVQFARSLKGDEKGEAQLFLDRFFQALGHRGVQEAGATLEFRIDKRPGSAQLELLKGEDPKPKRTKFADLLWPGRVLVEMKKRGSHLEKAYDQLFEYWQLIVPNRPAYAILCNFDEFWIYDFNTQLFDPVDRVPLSALAESASAFNFLRPIPAKPIFDNNRVDVTRQAAHAFASVFRKLVARGEDRTRAQRFILQLLVAVVAEDLDLLPDKIVTGLLAESAERPADSYDLLGGLFRQMAAKEPARGGRYVGVQYFNGGLFEHAEAITLKLNEAEELHKSVVSNKWSQVKPEIFGTLFQQSMEDGSDGQSRNERHAFGAHFTSEADIMKVVGPTISRPWRERIEGAGKSLGKLRDVLRDLRLFRVLDPACGSGNFLFVAYREIKRLERTLLLALRDAGERPDRLVTGISLTNFFGIDVLPFAVELAKVTLMLAKELELREAEKFEAADGLHLPERPLPLDNLDTQIVRADALFTPWPKADAIIGNPPYLGSRYLAQEQGYEYAQKVYARDAGVPKMVDFCVHWFRLAHDALLPNGRAGLVGTNTIRQNESREASLDYIVKGGGSITEAVSTEVWSGEAAVHVSIVNWVKGNAAGKKLLYTQRGDSVESPWEIEEMENIPSTLRNGTDVTGARLLVANEKSKKCYTGQNPVNAGFFLAPDEAAEMIRANARNREVLFPYMIGRDLVEEYGPTRWIIDFAKRDQFAARSYVLPWEWVQKRVMPIVLAKAEAEKKAQGKDVTRYTRIAERWWQFYDYRPGTIAAINSVPRYLAISRVTKRSIFEFVSQDIHADSSLVIFALADDYSFGIIQSGIHFEWFKALCSTLEGRFRYTSDTVFDTFPWPQTPTKKQIAEVAAAAVALRSLRREIMGKLGCSLRDLYRTLEDPGANPLRVAQNRLDEAVRAAYGMTTIGDTLDFLLKLNLSLAAKEKAGEAIVPPGLPLPGPERSAFITEDCIRLPSAGLSAFVNQAREGVRKTRAEARQMTSWQIREQLRRNAS